jgi:hypothetical protein
LVNPYLDIMNFLLTLTLTLSDLQILCHNALRILPRRYLRLITLSLLLLRTFSAALSNDNDDNKRIVIMITTIIKLKNSLVKFV